MNQIEFIAQINKPQLNKIQVLRKLAEQELTNLNLWKKYNSVPKRFKEKEILAK